MLNQKFNISVTLSEDEGYLGYALYDSIVLSP